MTNPQKKVQLKALQTLANRGVAKGDRFEASAEDARVLVQAGRAEKIETGKAK